MVSLGVLDRLRIADSVVGCKSKYISACGWLDLFDVLFNDSKGNEVLRVFIASNQVTLDLLAGHSIQRCSYRSLLNLVFYDASRCRFVPADGDRFFYFPINKMNLILALLLVSLVKLFSIFRDVDLWVGVPHFKIGRMANVMCSFSSKLILLDDGLDSFREVPRNLVKGDLAKFQCFLGFGYPVPAPCWQKEILWHEYVDTSHLIHEVRNYDYGDEEMESNTILIESPGVERVLQQIPLAPPVLVVRHSNPRKRASKMYPASFSYVAGGAGMEAGLLNFPGTIIVGESMSLVMLLLYGSTKNRVVVALQAFDNLARLRRLIEFSASRGMSIEVV